MDACLVGKQALSNVTLLDAGLLLGVNLPAIPDLGW